MRFSQTLVLAVAALATLGLLIGCGLDDGGPDVGPAGPNTATINGTVTPNNVAVTITDQNDPSRTTTTSNGAFTLVAALDANGRARLRLTATGYLAATVIEPELSNGSTVAITVTMKAANPTGDLIPVTGGTAKDNTSGKTNPATVEFQANSILNAAGVPATTTVTVTNDLPADNPNYLTTFPGLFLGTRTNGTTTPFESFGFVDVDLGEGFRLDPTKPATITFPVSPSNDPGPSVTTIPIWYLATDTGQWIEAGVATRATVNGKTVYQAQVTHFTTYNLDRPFEGGSFTVTVSSGTAVVANAKVTVTSSRESNQQQGAWKDVKYTNTEGKATFNVPAGYLSIKAEKDGATAYGWGYDASGTATVSFSGYPHYYEPFTTPMGPQ